MTPSDREKTAAEYSLGTLRGKRRARLQNALDLDPALNGLVEAWDRRLAPLNDALPPIQPPASLLPRIEQRLFGFGVELPGTVTLRADQGEWVPLAAGVEAKVLYRNPVLKRQSVLIRIAPGASYETHRHPEDEECYVVEGSLSFGDHRLSAGDYHLAFKGGAHPPAHSKTGCLLFITTVVPA